MEKVVLSILKAIYREEMLEMRGWKVIEAVFEAYEIVEGLYKLLKEAGYEDIAKIIKPNEDIEVFPHDLKVSIHILQERLDKMEKI